MTELERPRLLTGATGYVAGRLAPRLLEAGHRVRCLARSPEELSARAWIRESGVEVVEGDLNDPESVRRAMDGCGAAFYLVHSMEAAGGEYAERDRRLRKGLPRPPMNRARGTGQKTKQEIDSRASTGVPNESRPERVAVSF